MNIHLTVNWFKAKLTGRDSTNRAGTNFCLINLQVTARCARTASVINVNFAC